MTEHVSYYGAALDLCADTLRDLKPEDVEARAPKIGAILRNAADTLRRVENEARDMYTFVDEFASEPCSYGDNCPTFGTRHGKCLHCKARETLERCRTIRYLCYTDR